MPQSRSAKKDVRQNAKRRAVNHWRKKRIKDQSRLFIERNYCEGCRIGRN